MKTLLIASTNKGKVAEMKRFLETLPFDIISLQDLDSTIQAPEETEETIEGNAILKAKYYGNKTGYLTLADDSGMFIDALDGWPGVHSATVADTNEEKVALTLEKMKDIPAGERTATFQSAIVLFEPVNETVFLSKGVVSGAISLEPAGTKNVYGYNTIFTVDGQSVTYADLTVDQKNAISHRAKALNEIKYQLQNQYSGRNVIVPLALIAKDGKLLMSLRNDPHRPEFDRVWEFPGGAVEYGESVEETLIREVKEEIGYDIEIISSALQITNKSKEGANYKYQVFLIPYVCKIIGGDGIVSDAEVLETRWFDLEEVPKLHLFDDDDTMIKALTPRIQAIMKEQNI